MLTLCKVKTQIPLLIQDNTPFHWPQYLVNIASYRYVFSASLNTKKYLWCFNIFSLTFYTT